MPENTPNTTEIVRDLNDAFRTTFVGGKVLLTQGVQSLGQAAIGEIVRLVQNHSDFCEENDPHGEHDFGSFDYSNDKFFWKIDYYDSQCEMGSPDASDPSQTTRVLTIMLASEY